jgi:hypothetical protein
MFVAMIVVSGPTNLMTDFRAFYCGGAAIAQGANPYLEEPLHSCERRTRMTTKPAFLASVTVPAPLPPYALVAFAPLSRLPFPLAAALYGLLSIAAMCAAVALFAREQAV